MDILFHVATCNKRLTSFWVALALLSRLLCLLLIYNQEGAAGLGSRTSTLCVCSQEHAFPTRLCQLVGDPQPQKAESQMLTWEKSKSS